MNTGYALFVGVDQYDNVSDLLYCSSDAVHLASKIAELKAFSATKGKQVVLTSKTSPAPTRSTILAKLGEGLSKVESDSTVLFYFAGHGIEIDGNPYLLPKDFERTLPDLTSIAVTELMSAMRRAGVARRIIILDSCYSGLHRGERAPTPKGFQEFQSSIGRAFVGAAEGLAVLSSASIDEKARERPLGKSGHGVFTHSLIQALQELRKESMLGEDIFIERLHHEAFQRTIACAGREQHPRFFCSLGDPIIVFKSTGSKAARRVDRERNIAQEIRKEVRRIKSKNKELQRLAVERLIQFGADAVEDLLVLLDDSDADVRDWAAHALGEIGDRRAILPLLGAMRNRDWGEKPLVKGASEALAKIGSDIVPLAVDYMAREHLGKKEEDRILQLILPLWDGKANAYGLKIMDMLRFRGQEYFPLCPNTPFVIKAAEAKLREFGKEKKVDDSWEYEMAVYTAPLQYLLKVVPDHAIKTIRSHPLFRSGKNFRKTMAHTCEDAGSREALKFAKQLRKKSSGQCG